MTDKIFSHPDRVRPRFRPLAAIGHFRKLIADKENTEEVFRIFEALPRKGFVDDARSFVMSDKGQRLMVSEPYLPAILDDHDALLQLPANSVGRAYVNFMRREGLSAAGLVAESEKFDGMHKNFDDMIGWYGNRLRDTHDLMHILTGYGRDALGEQCVLGFNYGQNKNWGNLLIAYAGGYELRRQVKTNAPVLSAVREGQKAGKLARRLLEEDIRALLAEPLDEARARMGIGEPVLYKKAHEVYRAQGIDPYNFLANAAAA